MTTVDQIGTFLEHQGFSDDAIDDFFLEHFGKKGMKWGVRRDRRANNLVRVGKGDSPGGRIRALGSYTPLDAIKLRGLERASLIRGTRQLARNKRVRAGESSVKDKLLYYGGTRYQDVIPTSKSSTNTKSAVKASVAGAVVVAAGAAFAVRLLGR